MVVGDRQWMIERDNAFGIYPLLAIKTMPTRSEIVWKTECIVHECTARIEEHIGAVDRFARHVEHSRY